jgi:hypothetical protein
LSRVIDVCCLLLSGSNASLRAGVVGRRWSTSCPRGEGELSSIDSSGVMTDALRYVVRASRGQLLNANLGARFRRHVYSPRPMAEL